MWHEIRDQYDEIGHVEQLHGVHGEVEVILHHGIDAAEQLAEHTLVYLQLKSGAIIPARVTGQRIAEKPGHRSLFVKFDHSENRETAAGLVGAYVLTEKKQWGPGVTADQDSHETVNEFEDRNIEELIDFKACDSDGALIGQVIDAEKFPAQRMLLVELSSDYGSTPHGYHNEDNQHIMVPLVDEYVIHIDPAQRSLVLKNVERLILTDEDGE